MDFADVVRRRRMVRRYRPEPVPADAVARIVDAARRAPSAGFSQGQSFVVLTEPDARRRHAQLCDEGAYVARGFAPWLSSAPVHVVLCTRPAAYLERYAAADKAGRAPGGRDTWTVPWWYVDAGAALEALLLAAVAEGLAAGFQAIHAPDAVRDLLAIPADVEPLGVVTVGHPAPDRPSGSLRRGRRPWDETVFAGRWGVPLERPPSDRPS